MVAPEPVITPPVKEETPKLPVTQSSTAVEPKVTSRKSTDVSASWNGKQLRSYHGMILKTKSFTNNSVEELTSSDINFSCFFFKEISTGI